MAYSLDVALSNILYRFCCMEMYMCFLYIYFNEFICCLGINHENINLSQYLKYVRTFYVVLLPLKNVLSC